MEKRTIGKFIAILRKANGMTQKELGDKLYVSDKTVSRWENDESLPDLNLIPTIAEIFGVTTDELLRGERAYKECETEAEERGKMSARSTKQIKTMIGKNARRFNNFTLITVGVVLLGIIVAAVCNFAFFNCILAGALALTFMIAAAICQICFTTSHTIDCSEEDYETAASEHNIRTVERTARVLIFIAAAALFCLPLLVFPMFVGAGKYCLNADTWIPFGTAAAVIGVLSLAVLYKFVIRSKLIRDGILNYSEEERERLDSSNRFVLKLLVNIVVPCFMLLSLFALNALLNNLDAYSKVNKFETEAEMGDFLEKQYDDWFYQSFGTSVEKRNDGSPKYSVLENASMENGRYICQNNYYLDMTLVYDKDGNFLYYFGEGMWYKMSGNDADGYELITMDDHGAGEDIYGTVNVFLTVIGVISLVIITIMSFKRRNVENAKINKKERKK